MLKLSRFILVLLIIITFAACSTNDTLPVDADVITGVPEVPSPNPTAIPTPAPEPTPIPILTATIVSAGDVIMHDKVIRSGKISDDQYDYRSIFNEVKPYIDESDFSIISYEGVVMDSDRNYTGYPLFNAPPAIMTAFAHTGFDMVNQANNHCLDRKLKGLLESRSIIKQENLQVIGTYQDAAEPHHKIQDLNGIKVGFLAYTYGCNGNESALTKEERDAHLSLIDRNRIRSEIEALSPRVDFVVMLMHWGVEYRKSASEEQKKLAKDMFAWGADIILGSHPHVVEPSEIHEIDGEIKYVVYGMGNYLSNQIGGKNPSAHSNEYTEDGMMIRLTLQKDMVTGKASLVAVKHIPTWLYRDQEDSVYKYTIYPIPSIEEGAFDGLDDQLAEKLRASYGRTIQLVQDYPEVSE